MSKTEPRATARNGLDLSGKHALITGGGTGLGRCMTEPGVKRLGRVEFDGRRDAASRERILTAGRLEAKSDGRADRLDPEGHMPSIADGWLHSPAITRWVWIPRPSIPSRTVWPAQR